MLAETTSGTSIAEVTRILSASIAPVIVISGVGLLLLTMSNRYSHISDLARDMLSDLETTTGSLRRHTLERQVLIVYRRARILRLAIIMAALCVFFVTCTVLSLFAGQVVGMGLGSFSVPCFGLSLFALLGSLFFFIRDVGISLKALELETGSFIGNLSPAPERTPLAPEAPVPGAGEHSRK
jgi:Protein of unknown function (DUF2721)